MNATGSERVPGRGNGLGRRFAPPGGPAAVAAAFLQRVES